MEIDIEMEPQQQGQTDGHIAVAGKIAIDLQRIAIDSHQILHPRIEAGIVEHPLHEVQADIVGDDRFFEKAAHQQEDAPTEHLVGNKQRTTYLRDEIAGTHNGTCHQLRKERDVEGIIQQTRQRLDVAPIDINGITQ